MSIDFWVVTSLMVLSVAFSTAIGFLLNWFSGLAFLVNGLVYSALVLWNQACVQSGGCTPLAWIWVLIYTILFLFVLVVLVQVAKARRAESGSDRDNGRMYDRDNGRMYDLDNSRMYDGKDRHDRRRYDGNGNDVDVRHDRRKYGGEEVRRAGGR